MHTVLPKCLSQHATHPDSHVLCLLPAPDLWTPYHHTLRLNHRRHLHRNTPSKKVFKVPKADDQQSGIEASCGAALKDVLVRLYRSNSEPCKPWIQQLHQALQVMGADAAAESAARHLQRQAARWGERQRGSWDGARAVGAACTPRHCMMMVSRRGMKTSNPRRSECNTRPDANNKLLHTPHT